MKREEALLLKIELSKKLVTHSEDLVTAVKQEVDAIDQYLVYLDSKSTKFITSLKADNEITKETLKNHLGYTSYSKLGQLITEIIRKNGNAIEKNELKDYLYDHYQLKWKNFNDTITSLLRGSHLDIIKSRNKENQLVYSLPPQLLV